MQTALSRTMSTQLVSIRSISPKSTIQIWSQSTFHLPPLSILVSNRWIAIFSGWFTSSNMYLVALPHQNLASRLFRRIPQQKMAICQEWRTSRTPTFWLQDHHHHNASATSSGFPQRPSRLSSLGKTSQSTTSGPLVICKS